MSPRTRRGAGFQPATFADEEQDVVRASSPRGSWIRVKMPLPRSPCWKSRR